MQAACPYCNGPVVAKSKMSTAGVVVLLAGLLLAPMLVGIPLIIAAFYMKENYHVCSSCGMRLAELAPVHAPGPSDERGSARTIPDQHGIGRCPTCGGGLVGVYAKCPHCASDVFWAGRVPMRTAQEATDEQGRQERLAVEERQRERERAERLAAQRQREHEEELARQREAQRQWEEQERRWEERKGKALRWGEERSRATLVVIVSVTRWLLHKFSRILRGFTRHRRDGRVHRALVRQGGGDGRQTGRYAAGRTG